MNEESARQINAVLNDGTLSAEEQQAAIARINGAAQSALRDLAAKNTGLAHLLSGDAAAATP